MLDLKPEYIDIRDEATPQRDGTVLRQKKVSFYLGKFGPFTERFDLDGFTMTQVQPRIDALKQQIQMMHS